MILAPWRYWGPALLATMHITHVAWPQWLKQWTSHVNCFRSVTTLEVVLCVGLLHAHPHPSRQSLMVQDPQESQASARSPASGGKPLPTPARSPRGSRRSSASHGWLGRALRSRARRPLRAAQAPSSHPVGCGVPRGSRSSRRTSAQPSHSGHFGKSGRLRPAPRPLSANGRCSFLRPTNREGRKPLPCKPVESVQEARDAVCDAASQLTSKEARWCFLLAGVGARSVVGR
ncbi:uncharacterized protein LOC128563236 [Nycticebus coucang]|uniref:uncharacterized protein LOC128563236 n=1 Tax=Nycticebus coucang TaxID=9470 RepID=UPI00234E2EED|nr:uncharacterized protein LOC128563236 [Nycticebus coucang]